MKTFVSTGHPTVEHSPVSTMKLNYGPGNLKLLFHRALILRALMTITLTLGMVCLGWGQTVTLTTTSTSPWTVPPCVFQITVKIWGGGGGSGGHGETTATGGGTGSPTTFTNNSLGVNLSASGGVGSAGATNNTPTAGGAGGTASGGSTNSNGYPGTTGSTAASENSTGGDGGGSPNGGDTKPGAHSTTNGLSLPGEIGNAPGGGAGGSARAAGGGPNVAKRRSTGGGGGGAYSFLVIDVTPDNQFAFAVGAGGAAGTGDQAAGGAGADGQVVITYTAIDPLSNVTASPSSDQIFCVGSSGSQLTASETGGGTITGRQWYKRASSGGANIELTGQTNSTYTPSGATLEAGTWWVVCQSTPTCGSTTTSNEVKVDVLSNENWIGGTSGNITNWHTAGNWCNGSVPTSSNDVSLHAGLANYPTILAGASADCKNLTINSGASLTIESSSVSSNGSLIVHGSFTGPGEVTYNRQMRTDDWHYFSSPVGGQSISTFTTNNTDVTKIWKWDEPNWYGDINWSWIEVTSGNLESGTGYNLDQTGVDGMFSFTGSVVTSIDNVLATAPYTSYANHYQNNRGTWGGGGWNLLGNPFTSAMDASLFIDANDGTGDPADNSFDPSYQALYIYDGVNNIYKYAGVSAPDVQYGGSFGQYIQAGQGFFVLANYDGVSFDFSSSMQTHNTTVPMTKSVKEEDPWPGLQLKVKYGSNENLTTIVYNSEMTAGLDPGYDVGQLSAGPEVEIYTRLVMDNEINFARQALPLGDYEENIVPVGIDSENGGEVTFSAFVIPIEGRKFVLEDRLTNTFTNLETDTYTITLPPQTYGTGRFYIHSISAVGFVELKPDAQDQLNIKAWAYDHLVNVEGELSSQAMGTIYDVMGRMIVEKRLTGDQLNTFTVPASLKGIYLLRVTDGEKVATRKVVF